MTNKKIDRAKVRLISLILGLFLIPNLMFTLGFIFSIFSLSHNYSDVYDILIVSFISFPIGIGGIKGLFERKLYGKWMAFVCSLLLLGYNITSHVWIRSDEIPLGLKKGILFNKFDNYKIIQFLFNPIFLKSLLLIIAIALILSLPKSYFSENGEVNSKING